MGAFPLVVMYRLKVAGELKKIIHNPPCIEIALNGIMTIFENNTKVEVNTLTNAFERNHFIVLQGDMLCIEKNNIKMIKEYANSFGEYLTPSVVSIDDGELIVGKIAKERLVTNPETTTSLFKRNMGTATKVKLSDHEFLPEELSALVIKQLLEDASAYLQEPIEEAVISVPAYFNATARAATKLAGQLAGVKVERLINEPSAAALAHYDGKEEECFIVLDLGGGTFDVSIVDCFDNVVSICAIAGDDNFGGRDFDTLLVKYVCQENDIDFDTLNKRDVESLYYTVEKSKIALQDNEEVIIKGKISNGIYKTIMTNDIFYDLCSQLFMKIKGPIKKAINNSGLDVSEIHKCILVGGSCHMKVIQRYLMSLLKLPVESSCNLDEMVVRGIGKYVGIKERKENIKDLVLTDICPFSLGVSIHNEYNTEKSLMKVMIPKNSVLPTSVSEKLYTIRLGQEIIHSNICQGESIYSDDNHKLADLKVEIPKNLKEHEAIEVTFTYDINAILIVECLVVSTNKKVVLVLRGDGSLMNDSEALKQAEYIKGISLKITNQEQKEFLFEKAQRIYEELDIGNQEIFKDYILEFDVLTKQCANQLHKLKTIYSDFEKILEEYEQLTAQSDIFNEQENLLS